MIFGIPIQDLIAVSGSLLSAWLVSYGLGFFVLFLKREVTASLKVR